MGRKIQDYLVMKVPTILYRITGSTVVRLKKKTMIGRPVYMGSVIHGIPKYTYHF